MKNISIAKICTAAFIFLLLFIAGKGVSTAVNFEQEPAAPALLPKLNMPLNLDGELNEWIQAACVPVHNQANIAKITRGREWRGPSDASMEYFCAWNENGLCIAAQVADDDVSNNLNSSHASEKDGLDIYIDGRPVQKLMKSPYSAGAYQMFAKPPQNDSPAELFINPRDGRIEGVRIAGKRTQTGYNIEILIPWTAFPEFTPAIDKELGIQVSLVDYDRRDGLINRPLEMNYNAAKSLYRSPENFIRWKLCDKIVTGNSVTLSPQAGVFAPAVSNWQQDMEISFELGRNLSMTANKINVTITQNDKICLERSLRSLPLSAPWNSSLGGSIDWRLDNSNSGNYKIKATFYNHEEQILGYLEKNIIIMTDHSSGLDELMKIDIPKMANENPFRASAYMGAAACYLKYRQAVASSNRAMFESSFAEFNCRLSVLSGQTLSRRNGLFDLLNLASIPETQIAVEYPSENNASISFYCGSIPFLGAQVKEFENSRIARTVFETENDLLKPAQPEHFMIDGHRTNKTRGYFDLQRYSSSNFSPHTDFVLVMNRQYLAIASQDDLQYAQVDAVTILPDCPEDIRRIAGSWAHTRNCPIVPLKNAFTKQRILIAGDISKGEIADRVFSLGRFLPRLEKSVVKLEILDNDRIITIKNRSYKAALKAASLIVARQAIKIEEIDDMLDVFRREIRGEEAPPAQASTDQYSIKNLFCGDIHMHTTHSDGRPVPEELMLQAIYCNMDFSVITDHNAVSGAQEVERVFSECGVNYPIITGEEITFTWAHFNAFPLKTVIPPTELSRIVSTAHQQGAIIQWNHPGWPGSEWDFGQQAKVLEGTGLDAWEHYPPFYDKWMQAGATLPAITGSTDTHTGTFDFLERTAFISSSADFNSTELPDTIKNKHISALLPITENFVYGDPAVDILIWSGLTSTAEFRKVKAERIAAYLSKADLNKIFQSVYPPNQ